MAVGVAYVFPGFLTPVLTQLFFPKPPTTFLTCFCGKKSRLNRGSNSHSPFATMFSVQSLSFNSHNSVVACSFFEFGTVSKWCIGEWVKIRKTIKIFGSSLQVSRLRFVLKVAFQILGRKFYKNTKGSSLYCQSLLIFIHGTPVVERHPITREIGDLL